MYRTMTLLIMAAVFGSAATLGLSRFAFPTANAAGGQEPVVVRGQRFELVDGNGAVRATLGINPAGLPAFALLDEAGQERFIIAGNPMGGYGMSIRAADGAVRFGVAHGASGGEAFAGLNIRDAAGTIRANLFATDDGSQAGFNVFDADGGQRSRLGYYSDTETPVLRFVGPDGEVIWQAP
jgi:hypothetical protein